MQSPEEFVNELFLAHQYDPVKRREYYLKTRQLKGRRHGSNVVKLVPRQKPSIKTAAQRRKEIEAHVAALQARLEKLQKVLAQLVREAQARNGQNHSKDSHSKTDHNSSKKTAKQKAAAAKSSKKYYQKHKAKILSEQVKDLDHKIKLVQERIRQMRAQLEKPGSVGLRRSTTKVGRS